MGQIAPMLSYFGYDLNSDKANYGTPDKELLDKMNAQTKEEKEKWSEKEKQAIRRREKFVEEIRSQHQAGESHDIPH